MNLLKLSPIQYQRQYRHSISNQVLDWPNFRFFRLCKRGKKKKNKKTPPQHSNLAGIRRQHGLHSEGASRHGVSIIEQLYSVGTFLFWDVFDKAGAFPKLRLDDTRHRLSCRAGNPSLQFALTSCFFGVHCKFLVLSNLHS